MKLNSSLLATFVAMQISVSFAEIPFKDRHTLDMITKQLPRIERQADTLWPGLSSVNHLPIIFGSLDDTLYGLRFQPDTPNKWMQTAINNQPVYYRWTGGVNFAHSTFMTNPFFALSATQFENTPVIAFTDFDSAESEYLPGIFMDLYYWQYQYGYSAQAAQNRERLTAAMPVYSDYNRIEQSTLLLLQNRLMKEYLAKGLFDLLKDYVAVAQQRESLLSPEGKINETRLQHIYAPWMYLLLTQRDQQSTVPNEIIFDRWLDLDYDDFLILRLTLNHLGLHRMLQLTLSAAESFCLDRLSKEWKQQFVNSSESPTQLLIKLIPMSEAERSARIADAKRRYPDAEWLEKYSEYEEVYRQALQEYQAFMQSSESLVRIAMRPDDYDLLTYQEVSIDSQHNLFSSVFQSYYSDFTETDSRLDINVKGQHIPQLVHVLETSALGAMENKSGIVNEIQQRWPTETFVSMDHQAAKPLSALLSHAGSYQVTHLTLRYRTRRLTITAPHQLTVTTSANELIIKPNSQLLSAHQVAKPTLSPLPAIHALLKQHFRSTAHH